MFSLREVEFFFLSMKYQINNHFQIRIPFRRFQGSDGEVNLKNMVSILSNCFSQDNFHRKIKRYEKEVKSKLDPIKNKYTISKPNMI